MSDIRYVVRFFNAADNYLYSVHCSVDILDQILSDAKDSGLKFKVVAYKLDSESEV